MPKVFCVQSVRSAPDPSLSNAVGLSLGWSLLRLCFDDYSVASHVSVNVIAAKVDNCSAHAIDVPLLNLTNKNCVNCVNNALDDSDDIKLLRKQQKSFGNYEFFIGSTRILNSCDC